MFAELRNEEEKKLKNKEGDKIYYTEDNVSDIDVEGLADLIDINNPEFNDGLKNNNSKKTVVKRLFHEDDAVQDVSQKSKDEYKKKKHNFNTCEKKKDNNEISNTDPRFVRKKSIDDIGEPIDNLPENTKDESNDLLMNFFVIASIVLIFLFILFIIYLNN
jgi:hypothetical protein